MCIIAFRPANKTISINTLRTMFTQNPHGAGFMFAENGNLYVYKGYMTLADYLAAYHDIPANVNLVIHTRIGTQGTNSAGNTHPYPVTDDTCLLHATSIVIRKGYAFAHNGILYGMRIKGDFNDSQAFGVKFLAPLEHLTTGLPNGLQDDSVRTIIESAISGSRIAIMGTAGYVTMYGSGWVCDNGVYYSNSSYKAYAPPKYYYQNYSKNTGKYYDDLFDDDDFPLFSLKNNGKRN